MAMLTKGCVACLQHDCGCGWHTPAVAGVHAMHPVGLKIAGATAVAAVTACARKVAAGGWLHTAAVNAEALIGMRLCFRQQPVWTQILCQVSLARGRHATLVHRAGRPTHIRCYNLLVACIALTKKAASMEGILRL
jgi:hypothetical protein